MIKYWNVLIYGVGCVGTTVEWHQRTRFGLSKAVHENWVAELLYFERTYAHLLT